MVFTHYITKSDIAIINKTMKLKQCVHCGMTGMFILHGYLYGYNEYRTHRIIKGRRIFCSNRNKRKGCGRTIAYRIIDFLERTLISTHTAWHFLRLILAGTSIEKSYNSIDPECVISLSTFFRLWKRFTVQIDNIRTFLIHNYSIKKTNQICPYRETIQHISDLVTSNKRDPLAQYQYLSQSSFL